jgi:hypothetical protein
MLLITETKYVTNLLQGAAGLSRRQSYLFTCDQHASCTYGTRRFIEVFTKLVKRLQAIQFKSHLRPRFIPVLAYSPLSIYLSLVLFPGKNDKKVVHELKIRHLTMNTRKWKYSSKNS